MGRKVYKPYNETPTEGTALLNLKKFSKTKDPTPLEMEIARLLKDMQNRPSDSESYSATADQLAKLYKLNEESNLKKRMSPDVLTAAVTNLFGIVMILHYEHAHVMTSKAIGFVKKI